MKRIVQCVPNFSEGRDLEKIETIVAPLKNQEGFKLVGVEPDADYNRTVVTLIGDADAMIEALAHFAALAAKHIDMNVQSGEHPRMGALDVVPFIPISGITLEACAQLAEEAARRIHEASGIPIYLYAEAAKEKNRKRLPTIRKGEFEGMKEKIREEAWKPDVGPAEIHPSAGVCAVGARLPLIAYNIDLDTEDLDVAKRIARAIRGSSGGFKHVQAGPVHLKERKHVQVTMNILDYKQNPLYRVFETVAMEARRDHVEATGCEIVGLVPKDTLLRSLKYYTLCAGETFDETLSLDALVEEAKTRLKIRDFDKMKIIEAHLE